VKRHEVVEALYRTLTKHRNSSKRLFNFPCYEYEDRYIYGSLLKEKMQYPRMCAKYIDEEALTILHPLLLCTTTYLRPLLVYVRFKAEIPPPKKEKIIQKKLSFLKNVYPAVYEAINALPDEISAGTVIVDGRRSNILDLVSCPSIYGLFIGESKVVFIGGRKP